MVRQIKSDIGCLITSLCTKFNITISVELGCCNGLTEDIDASVLSNITYDKRPILCSKAKRLSDSENTNFVLYSDVYNLCKEVLSHPGLDLAVVGGPLEDRGLFAQSMVDSSVPVIVLLDFDEPFKCGYTSIRHYKYWSRVFNDPYGGKIKVLVNNPLDRIFVHGFE